MKKKKTSPCALVTEFGVSCDIYSYPFLFFLPLSPPLGCEVLETPGLWVPLVLVENVYVLPGIPRLFTRMVDAQKEVRFIIIIRVLFTCTYSDILSHIVTSFLLFFSFFFLFVTYTDYFYGEHQFVVWYVQFFCMNSIVIMIVLMAIS